MGYFADKAKVGQALKERYEKAAWIFNKEDPQESLVPIGGNFYATPNTPADPMDCDRYPDSPWCGENPIDLAPVALEIDIVRDECNFGIQFSGTLGFIKLPPFQIVYRNPNCQPKPKVELPPLEDNYTRKLKMPDDGNINFVYRKSYSHAERGKSRNTLPLGNADFKQTIDITNVQTFDSGIYLWKFDLVLRTYNSFNGVYFNAFKVSNYSTVNQLISQMRMQGWDIKTVNSDPFNVNSSYKLETSASFSFRGQNDITSIGIPGADYAIQVWYSRDRLQSYIDSPGSVRSFRQSYKDVIDVPSLGKVDVTDVTEEIWEVYDALTTLPPPPPSIKSKECKCMSCNDDLLKLILKRLGDLPAKVPDNFTKQHPEIINIESLAELILWQTKQLDALMGAYPIEIEIEDADLVKEGNQKETLKIPNQAEAIAELVGLVLTIKRDTHATLITALKAMGEAGMTKNLSTQILDVALANAEFLGYKLEQKKKEISSLFTPNGKDLAETLKEKNVEIVTYENTDKNDLQDDLKVLKTMAARWNAQNWRQIAGDPVEALKQKLFGNPDAIKETHKDKEQGDFNDFTEQAERGFIEVSGITDTVNPWSRPYKERPKIREIGSEKGRYDKDGKEVVK